MSAAMLPHVQAATGHGLPNWTDLHTARADRATAFYEQLLRWQFHRRPVLAVLPDPTEELGHPDLDDGSTRQESALVAGVDGGSVAEIVGRAECFEAKHLLSTWFPYVQVDDLDVTLDLVEPAGGLVLSPPATRGDEARVATILDPSDALLRVWQPGPDAEVPLLHRPGALTWIELETNDLDRASAFYGGLFGWTAGEVTGPDEEPYTVFRSGDIPVAGAVRSPLSELPASWCAAFAVADVDEAISHATEAGAVVMTDPTEMAMGRQAILVDPTGAVFGLLGPASTGPRPL